MINFKGMKYFDLFKTKFFQDFFLIQNFEI